MKAFFTSLLLLATHVAFAQSIDLLIKGGHVIDPRNNRNGLMDVAVKDGKVWQVAADIPTADAKQVVDAKGLYVVPGLIDIHGHHFFGTQEGAYLSNSYTALPPDGFTFRAGVTTVVDAGGAGWRNFRTFKEQAIDHSQTRVLGFINIVGAGMSGGATEQNLGDMDGKLTAMVARQFKDYVVGVKVAHYAGPEWTPVEQAVHAGNLANIPVMIDFGGHTPPLSLETLLMEKLRPGDILTHCYAHVNGREPVVGADGKLQAFVLPAQRRGIIFDVGHGGGSFLWAQAIPAVQQGFKPNSISTDLHTGSMNAGMKDMINVMSKMLNIGMNLQEVIAASTDHPARIIQRSELGHLSTGAEADIAVLRLENGSFGYVDSQGWKHQGNQKLTCEMTLRAGRVVWDLNGISRPAYAPQK